MAYVHRLRALTVELNLLGSEFATRNGLHSTDLQALICLLDAVRSGTPPTPGWLGSQLGISSASTTALVDRLEATGLLARTRDTEDRRRVLVTVTPRAEELGWSFFGPLIGRVVDVIDTFSPGEQQTISTFLARMQDAASDARDLHRS
nr:MarR family transcriptional regulator [Rhodococcus sp. SGAir0479]